MDFEDLIYMTMEEIEHAAIYQIAKCYGIEVTPDKADRCAAFIREDLATEFHGCFPYFGDWDEGEFCYLGYLGGCEYGCENCPMKNPLAGSGQWNPESDGERDMIVALIRGIKFDDNYEPTESEIKTAIDIIRR